MMTSVENAGVGISHHFGGGVYAKETLIPAGLKLTQHVHPFDHLSILASGSVLVKTPDGCCKYDGPACIFIKAGVAHEVTSLTKASWFCIHATTETDPLLIDEALT